MCLQYYGYIKGSTFKNPPRTPSDVFQAPVFVKQTWFTSALQYTSQQQNQCGVFIQQV